MRRIPSTVALFALLAAAPLYAGEPEPSGPKLGIGDPVPAVDIAHFFQGEPLKSFAKDKTYILEFWATWCGPCKKSMPHLRDLAKKYEGKVTIVALSDEAVETVGSFLEKPSGSEEKSWKDLMAFPIATDPDKSVKDAIFAAAGRTGIPSSFLISDGKVQWIGHPMGLDAPLEQVVNGTWDLEKAKQEYAEEAAAAAMMSEFNKLAQAAMGSGNWDEALAYLDSCLEKQPANETLAMMKWRVLLLFAQRDDEAYSWGAKLIEKLWDDAQNLNEIAWTIVDDDKVKTRDLKFALKVAERANELTHSKDGAILDTLARVHHDSGNLDEAIRLQTLAVEHSEGELRAQLEAVLADYKAKKAKG
jgi:thiol-disulfide isomerase/thioredoxin